jgi:methylmalonyl-CoA mutase
VTCSPQSLRFLILLLLTPACLAGACIEAAKARCTLGEMCSAMETVFGRHSAAVSLATGAYTSEYGDDATEVATTRQLVKAFADKHGRRPRILVAKMGQDGHDRGQKVISTGFADLGFDVDVGPLFSTPDEVAKHALESDVHIVGISTLAAGHKTLVPALVLALKAAGAGDIVVVAGGVIPHVDYPALLSSGCSAVFGPGTRVPVAAREVLALVDKAQS